MGKRAVFLDRDGVLTIPTFRDGRSFAPLTVQEFRLFPDAKTSVERLKSKAFVVIVATNQPDITTGKLSQRTLDEMHRRLGRGLAIDDIEVSTATRANPDRRRKPEPGMLIDAAQKWDIDLAHSYMVGDRASDVACGAAAGCRSVFVDLGYSAEVAPSTQDATVKNLSEAVDWILADAKQGG